ncbi:MAG: DUF6049 family protein [Micrococcales bacterium]|nr:DUF6049 family protein [Micrococcales bacterium]
MLVVAVLATTTVSSAALAATSPDLPTTTTVLPAITAPTAASIAVVDITPQILDVNSDDRLTVTVTVTNTTSRPLSGRLVLSLAPVNMRTRVDVQRWADGTMPVEVTQLVASPLTTPVAPGASTTVTLSVGPTARQMALANEWGPRGLVVTLDDAGTARGQTRTFLLVQSNQDIPQAPVTLLAALTGPPVAPVLPKVGDTRERTLGSESTDRMDQVLAAVRSVPQVSLAIDPSLITPDSAQMLSAVLPGRELLMLPWGDPDLQALTANSTTSLLTRARQVEHNPDYPQIMWSVDPLDAQTAATVRASGATWLVAPWAPRSAGTLTHTPTDGGDLVVVHPDAEISALFDGSAGMERAQAQQKALALLATAARGTGEKKTPAPVLVATSRDWAADQQWTEQFVTALDAAQWVRLTTTSDLIATGRDLPRTATEATPPGTGPLVALDQARRDLAVFATATDRPGVVTAGVDEAVLLVASYAWRSDPSGRVTAAQAVTKAIDQRRNGLRLTQPPVFNLLGSTGNISFNVRNDLPVAATVRVRMDPEKGCLAGDKRAAPADESDARVSPIWSEEVTVGPYSDTPVTVALYARANCDVTIAATLVASDGTTVTAAPVTFSARVRAQIESVGITVVGVLVALGLVLGVVRTVRRGQSARRGDRATTEPVRVGVLGGETPIAGIPVVKMLTPIAGIPMVKLFTPVGGTPTSPPPEPPETTTDTT